MKSKSLKIEILFNLIITLSIGLLTFVVNKYFSEYMGAKELGLMRLFTQMITYLSLAELGLGTASTYALYKPLADKDINKVNIIISTIGSLYKKIGIFILVIGLLLNPIIPFFIKDKFLSGNIYLYWSLYVLNTAFTYSFAKYNILFTADQNFKLVRIIQGISRITSQCLQIFILLKYRSFTGFILLLILENLIQYIFYIQHYKKNYSYIKYVEDRSISLKKDLFNLFFHKIAGLIIFNTDYIIISKFISLTMVGIYSSYLIVVSIISTIIRILTNVISPKIGNYISKNNKEKIFKLWKKINIIFVFLGIIFTYMTFKLINSFIYLWIGKEYLLGTITVILIMINLFIIIIRIMTDIFKNGCGFFSDIHLPILEGIINLILSLILVQYLGINGVIIGTVASNIIIILIAKPILVFKECFDKDWKVYIKILLEYLILSTIVIFISEFIVNKFIEFNNIITWFDWIKTSIKLLIVTGTVSTIVFNWNKDFRENLKYMLINIKK